MRRALEPLGRGRHRRVGRIGHQVAAERADALGAHGVSLIGHRGRADLVLFKRLFDLAVVLEQANVVRHAVGALRDGREHIQNTAVGLSRIGLAADGEALFKAELRGDAAVHLVDLVTVALEEVDKARLRARRAAAAEEAHRADDKIKLFKVRAEVLHPQRRALADRHGLRGLIVRIAERRRGGVFAGKCRKIHHHAEKLPSQVFEAVAIQHQIGVVRHIAARRAEVDDAGGGRRRLAVGVHMRHHIVAHLVLALFGDLVVDVGDVRGELVDLLLRDGQAQLVLGAGKRHPQSAPRLEAHIGGKEVQHVFGRIAGRKRGLVNILAHRVLLFFLSGRCSYFI